MSENTDLYKITAYVNAPPPAYFARVYTTARTPRHACDILSEAFEKSFFPIYNPDIKLENIKTGEVLTATSVDELWKKLIAMGTW
jgi:hypothetical protein